YLPVPSVDDGAGRHRWNRQYRRRGYGHRYRWSRHFILDVGHRPAGHGFQICRSVLRGTILEAPILPGRNPAGRSIIFSAVFVAPSAKIRKAASREGVKARLIGSEVK